LKRRVPARRFSFWLALPTGDASGRRSRPPVSPRAAAPAVVGGPVLKHCSPSRRDRSATS